MKLKNIPRNVYRSTLLILLSLVLVFSSLNLTVFAVQTTTNPAEVVDVTVNNEEKADKAKEGVLGTSSDANVVKITTEQELAKIAERVNQGDQMKDFTVRLENDIELLESWTPIGVNPEHPFAGKFNGQNYTISGLKVEDGVFGGLFGHLIDADVRGVHIKIISAKNATAGLFYKATRTTVENVSYQLAEAEVAPFSLRAFSTYAAPSVWTGVVDYSWHDGSGIYHIDSAAKFAGFRNIVNGIAQTDIHSQPNPVIANLAYPRGGDQMIGETVYLEADIDLDSLPWVPIGTFGNDDTDSLQFAGKFIGQGHTISNLKLKAGEADGGLFRYLDGATLSNFTLQDPEVISTVPGRTGAVAGYATSTLFDNINVINPEVRADSAAGITDKLMYQETLYGDSGVNPSAPSPAVTNCFVYSPKITANTGAKADQASGIVNNGALVGIMNSAVYGGADSYIKGGSAAGITTYVVGPVYTYAAISNSVVLGVNLEGSVSASGIADNMYSYSAIANGVVSDISFASGSLTSNFIVNNFGFDNGFSEIFGFKNIFSDTTLPNSFVNLDSPHYETLVWDEIRDSAIDAAGVTHYPIRNQYGNRGYSTNLLTQGWLPDATMWEANPNYYPVTTGSMNTPNKYVRMTAELAAVALIPVDPFERYTEGVRELRLMSKTIGAEPIRWDISTADPEAKKETQAEYPGCEILYTEKNDKIPSFDATATTTCNGLTFVKNFKDITLLDRKLEETSQSHTDGDIVPTTATFKRVFKDQIVQNPEVVGLIELVTRDKAGNFTVVEQSIVCDTALEPRFVITGGNILEVTFALREGVDYEVRYPEGAVKEADNAAGQVKKNFSVPYSVKVSTAAVGSPVIKLSKPVWQGSTQTPITLQELLDSFVIFETLGGPVMYDKNNPAILQEYTGQHGAWNTNDPLDSVEKILNAAIGPVAYYYVDNSSILGAGGKVGNARMYILAKNSDQRIDRKIMEISIIGTPDWIVKPDPFVHIEWTNNIEVLKTAAREGASAAVLNGDGSSTPSSVQVQYDEDEWQKAIYDRRVSTLVFKVVIIDQQGNAIKAEDVTIYMDCPLYWTMTPSPVTMSYTNKKGVEEMMNVVANTFKNDVFIYNHWIEEKVYAEQNELWNKNYREAGRYYVDLDSDPQYVTDCTATHKTCTRRGKHPNNRVEDMFIFDITYPPGEKITTYWGEMTKDAKEGQYLPEAAYSRGVVESKPQYFTMPKFVIESLAKQRYGKIQLEYGDLYRWKLYSDTLDKTYKWGDLYSLEVATVSDSRVTSLVGSLSEGMQFNFMHSGRLFGEVQFELKLDKLKSTYKNLPNKNLGLYAYNVESHRLDLVSDVVITEDGWASAAISEIIPTTYVLKSKGKTDELSPKVDNMNKYYQANKVVGEFGEWMSIETKDKQYQAQTKTMDEIAGLVQVEVDTAKGIRNKYIIVGVSGGALIAAVAGFIYYKRRKESV